MTDAEKLFWQYVRCDKIEGFRFYRQKPLGHFIVDFYCPKAKLVVEIDGGQHFENQGLQNDRRRDEWLHAQGLHVLRLSNIDVLENIEGVIEKVIECIKSPPAPL